MCKHIYAHTYPPQDTNVRTLTSRCGTLDPNCARLQGSVFSVQFLRSRICGSVFTETSLVSSTEKFQLSV